MLPKAAELICEARSHRSRAAELERLEQSLTAWSRMRDAKMERAVAILMLMLPLSAAAGWWLLPATGLSIGLLGAMLAVRAYRCTPEDYARVPQARDGSGHRCIFCGNRGVYHKRTLFGTRCHCLWCHTHLYTA